MTKKEDYIQKSDNGIETLNEAIVLLVISIPIFSLSVLSFVYGFAGHVFYNCIIFPCNGVSVLTSLGLLFGFILLLSATYYTLKFTIHPDLQKRNVIYMKD